MKKKSLIRKLREMGKEEILTIYGLVFTVLGLWLAYFYESYSFIIPVLPLNAFCSYFIYGEKQNWKGLFIYIGIFLITALLLWFIIPQQSFETDGLLLLSIEILSALFTAIGIIFGVILSSKVRKMKESKNRKKVRNSPISENDENHKKDTKGDGKNGKQEIEKN